MFHSTQGLLSAIPVVAIVPDLAHPLLVQLTSTAHSGGQLWSVITYQTPYEMVSVDVLIIIP